MKKYGLVRCKDLSARFRNRFLPINMEINEKIPFNMNGCIYVKLNEAGEKILKEQYDQAIKELKEEYRNFKVRLPFSEMYKKDVNGYIRLQMWSFMEHFGQYLCVGCDDLFDMDIFFEVSDDEIRNIKE